LPSAHRLVNEWLLYADVGSSQLHRPDLIRAEACDLLRYDNRATLVIEEGSLCCAESAGDEPTLTI
jgi:hypothetical protein